MNEPLSHIGFIGFGEVGGIFGQDLVSAGKTVTVFDPLLHDSKAQDRLRQKAKTAGVRVAENMRGALINAQLIFAATTASSALAVARDASTQLSQGQIYIDLNSVSPDTKRAISVEIGKSKADFVEAAVMAAVKTARLKTPILLGGGRAAALAEELTKIDMDTTAVSDKIGVASAIKMCRSIVMKGMAALVIESLFTARRYGAEDAVLASFEATYPSMGWSDKLPDSLAMRAVEHSRRRAAEMRESAETVQDAGLEPRMALAIADLQDWLTTAMDEAHYQFRPNQPFSWRQIADLIAPSQSKPR
jgi:3-hydroxyisobutyrate dehydrogenase-like beta-hydroxyacid dehydrogenase